MQQRSGASDSTDWEVLDFSSPQAFAASGLQVATGAPAESAPSASSPQRAGAAGGGGRGGGGPGCWIGAGQEARL